MLTKAKLREGGRKRWEGIDEEARKAWSKAANVARWANATDADRAKVKEAMAKGKAAKALRRKEMKKRSP